MFDLELDISQVTISQITGKAGFCTIFFSEKKEKPALTCAIFLSADVMSVLFFHSCFFKNTRVASIKVIVVDEWNQNIKYYISYVGLAVTVVGSMVCIFCICCKKSDKSAQ